MSEFLAEAQVVVRPNTAAFRTELVAQLAKATAGVTVPIKVVPVGAGAASLAAGFSNLTKAQEKQLRTTLQNAGALDELNKRLPKSTAGLLGAEGAAAKLNAGLLGLRTAIGSSAVIGLGALALAAIAAGTAVSASIRNFAAFQQELATFRAISGATAEQMRAVSEQANRLGADVRLPAVSAADAAVAMTELAKAGLSVEDAMAGAEGVLQLATAAQISSAEASKIAANALNSFGLAGDQAARVADSLANAANAAQGSISDFGFAFAQSSAVARQVGLSLEDTTAILSLFAKNGLQGSDAGTSLRVALIRLVAPTKAAAAEIEKLGLDIRDASGAVRADVFAQFGEATRNLSPAVRDASAALIFGQDAIRAVAIGAREGTDGLRLMQFQIDQTGTAAEVAAARTSGLAGKFSALQSTAETLSVRLGEIASPILSGVIDQFLVAADAATKFGDALGQIEGFIPAGAQKEVQTFRDTVADLGKRGLGPFAGFTLTAKAALDIYNSTVTTSEERTAKLNEELQALQTARVAAQEGGQRGIADQLTKEINALRDEIEALEAAGKGIDIGVTAPLKRALAEAEKARDIRISVNADTTSLDRLIASLKESIPITQQVEGNIQRLRDDFGDLADAARGGATGVDALSSALSRLRTQSAAASDELLKAQNEGASPQAQVSILQGQRQTQEDIIANLRKGGITAGEPSQIRAARQEINRIQAEIDGLQAGIASDARSAATDAKKRSDDIAKAQEDATKAFLEGFDPKKQKILNAITAAGLTERLSDDIKFNVILRNFLRRQIEAIQDRIKRLGLQGAALGAARDAIRALNQEIFRLTNEIAQDQKSALERTQDILNQKIDFKIQIAQAQDNVAAELRARRAKLAQITKELVAAKKAFGKNSLAWLELKAAQAEQIAAIKELQNQNKTEGEDARKSAAAFFFSQLQAQQGFAANLLGNLITGPTEGLVGVPAPPSRDVKQAAAVQEGKASGGPSAGQANTTNDILLRILRQLRQLNGATDAPEAIVQKKSGLTIMDNYTP